MFTTDKNLESPKKATDEPADPSAPKPQAPPSEKLYCGLIHCEGINTKNQRVECDINVKSPVSKEGVLTSFLNNFPNAIVTSFKFNEVTDKEIRDKEYGAMRAQHGPDTDKLREQAKGLAKSDAIEVEAKRAKIKAEFEANQKPL